MNDGGFTDRKEKKEKPNYFNTEVKLPASTLSFILECPCCGFEGPENYAPMCTGCNSSKKDRDALEWLAGRGFTLETMNLEVLIVYTRQMYRHRVTGSLDIPASGPTVYLLDLFTSRLPTQEHQKTFEAITGSDLLQPALTS